MKSVIYEQLKNRQDLDSELLIDSMEELGKALSGKGEKIRFVCGQNVSAARKCIQMLLVYYKQQPVDIPQKITDLYAELDYAVRPRGFQWRAIELKEGWNKNAFGVMLGSLSDGTPILLLPRLFSGYDIYDPRTGRKPLKRDKLEDIAEQALVFYRPFPIRKMTFGDLVNYIIHSLDVSDWLRFGLLSLIITLAGMFAVYGNSILFTNVIGVDSSLLPAVLALLLGVSVSELLFEVVKTAVSNGIQIKSDTYVESATMSRILTFPVSFFEKYSSAEISTRMSKVSEISQALSGSIFPTIMTSLFSLIYIGQIFALTPAMVVPALLVILMTTAVSVFSSVIQIKYSSDLISADTEKSSVEYAFISGVQKLKLSCAEKRAYAKWAEVYAKYVRLAYNPPMRIRLNTVLTSAVTLGGTIFMYYAAAKSGLTSAQYIAFSAAYGNVAGAFISLSAIVNTLAELKPNLEMIRPILETVPEISEGKQVVSKLNGNIELSDVSFRYSQDSAWILKDFSLKIRPGQYLAIVGRTGCGKTTLMKLLMGFVYPEKGAVYYDGQDLKNLDPSSLRRHMGVVMQDGKLLQGTIFENIALTAPHITQEEAWKAAEMAGIADDIRAMPLQMFTPISEDTGGVSGGQKQRILIARAIVANPGILLLDEATSALDNITQKQVSDSLDSLKCTRIVIAHRLSTIRHCDRIIMLDKGQIIEDGTYDELIQMNGEFAHFVERQRI